jgi:2-oxoglutarate ferredoxin oxidoreductase subunit alpha
MRDYSIGFLHFSQVWPLPTRALNAIKAAKRDDAFITVENNATGQLARLIQSETGIHCTSSILKYDGRPFTVDEVIDRLKAVVHHE